MKNIAINTLEYTGIVTLSQYIGSRKIKLAEMHNAGGNSLFEFFANCLAGEFDIAEFNRPAKIMLLSRIANTNEYVSASAFIGLLSKPEKIYQSGMCKVRYSFVLSRDILQSSLSNFTHIGLYSHTATSADISNFAAICEINKDRWSNISESALLAVDWELNISNVNS